MTIALLIAVWLGVAVIAVGVTRFVAGDDFDGEEHIPPCILWPMCLALLIPIGIGYVLFYWVPIKSADAIRAGLHRMRRRKQIQPPTEHYDFTKPPDWKSND